ncbi:MAG: hypothetical protein PHN84_05460 [Desulfuromonadaceae bacterium]|nr:hypothetical protein [Desulfuromonadaceae bacterium]MDD2855010.1 hypothetical protein [Desulfuromonadaceae bacterium]
MKKLVFCFLFLSWSIFGCAQNHFNIPAENFAEKVKVIGVVPIFVDPESDIVYPEKDLLIPLVYDMNRRYEPILIKKLKATENFYSVALQQDESKELFNRLFYRREKRDDAGVQYNKYFWKNDEISSYLRKNNLDAVMVVVVSGLTKTTKIYSSNLMTSLETDYNFLTMTAQILGSNGELLWEYPNFRGRILPYYPLVNLQYPDFSESEANLSTATAVKFKSIDGIRRTLEKKKSDVIFRETREPEIYGRLFDEMIYLITNSAAKKRSTNQTPQNKTSDTPKESNESKAAGDEVVTAPVAVSNTNRPEQTNGDKVETNESDTLPTVSIPAGAKKTR